MSTSAPDAVTFSDLSRNPRAVAERAARLGRVRITHRDAPDFYLTAADREEQREENLSTAARVFAALMKQVDGAGVVLLALVEVFPWVRHLADGELGEFARELVAALSDAELSELIAVAASVGLDALVEVHDETEAARALSAGATMVGVNQRDLFTFEVDTGRAVRVAAALPEDVCRIAESGITSPADAETLAAAGFDAVLVGEYLVRSSDPAATVSGMARAARRTRAVSGARPSTAS